MKKFLPFLLLLVCSLSVSAQNQRRVLIEEFTNASCGPCAGQNPNFNTLLANNSDKITAIKYQTVWPGVDPMNAQNTTDVAARVTYYSVGGVPNGFVDGVGIPNDCGYYDFAPACLSAAEIANRFATTSPVKINLSYSYSAAFDSILVDVSVTSDAALTGTLRLNVAVVEEEIAFDVAPGTNGETEFFQVMRKMLPNAGGTITGDFTAGETKTFKLAWKIAYAYDLNQLAVVAWLQDNATKFVHNSARTFPLGTIPSSGVKVTNGANPYVCVSGSPAEFTMQNIGTANLTTANMRYRIGTGAWVPFVWTGDLAPGASELVQLPGVSITANGTNKFEVRADNSNLGIQTDLLRSAVLDLRALFVAPAPLPWQQTFQTGSFPSAGNWSTFLSGTRGWKLASNAGSGGSTRSVKNEMYYYANATTSMTSQKIDLSTASGTTALTFDYAYAKYDDTYYDSLSVAISTDCGETWNEIFRDGHNGLATGASTTAEYVPAAGDWVGKTFDISSFNGQPEVLIKFDAISGYGNNVYLDNINVATVSSVKPLELVSFAVQPNPTKDISEVRFELPSAQNIQIRVFDMLGSLVQNQDLGTLATGEHRIKMDATRMSAGSYRIVIQGAEGVAQTQWMVVK